MKGERLIKNNLASDNLETRMSAISEALKYGDRGLDLIVKFGFDTIVEALTDRSPQVRRFARKLLKEKGGAKGKKILLDRDLYFTTFKDWDIHNYHIEDGIYDPFGKAYAFNLDDFQDYEKYDEKVTDFFAKLTKYPYVNQIQALICKISRKNNRRYTCAAKEYIDALVTFKDKLINLQALFIGDEENSEYKGTSVHLEDLSPILKAYPNLQILQVRVDTDYFVNHVLNQKIQNENLKTLIIESGRHTEELWLDVLEAKSLEYLELWNRRRTSENFFEKIAQKFPKLEYLGLRSYENTDRLVELIVNSPLIEQLQVLDLSYGSLTKEGVSILKQSPAIKRLHTLNISMNYIALNKVKGLSKLSYRVIPQPQTNYDYRYYTLHE